MNMKQKPLKKHKGNTPKPPKGKKGLLKRIPHPYLLFIIFLTLIVYGRAINADFTNWDDEVYIHENPYIKQLNAESIANIFSEGYFGNYHPLTTITYAVEYSLFGLNPRAYHTINILLHLLNIFLVFLFVKKLSGHLTVALITAFVFALHPLHVESVAWIAERKDVLYTFFMLLSLNYYLKFLNKEGGPKTYLLMLLFTLSALMSKSAAVVTPLLMLLIYFYIRKKFILKQLLHLLPFFLLSLIFGLIAINTQVEAIGNLNTMFPGLNRALIVCYALYYYLTRFLAPINMAALHNFPEANTALPFEYYFAPAVLVAAILLVVFSRNELKRQIIFGLLFFLISLLLVIQIIPVGQAIVAERYTYVPYIGLAFIVAQMIVLIYKRIPTSLLYTVLGAYAIFITASTWAQVGVWQNSETLWTKTLKVYPENQIAYNNRGLFRTKNEEYNKAYDDFDKLIAINPEYEDVFNNRATACFNLKDYNCVIRDLTEAIKRKPDVSKLYNNRGLAKSYLNDYIGAIEDYTKSISIDSLYIDAYNNRKNALEAINNLYGALQDMNTIIQIDPNDANYFNSRGILLGKMNNFPAALADFEKATSLNPSLAEAFTNKGFALFNIGNISEACDSWQKSVNLGNNSAANMINSYCK